MTHWKKFKDETPEFGEWIWFSDGDYCYPSVWKGLGYSLANGAYVGKDADSWTYAEVPELPKEEIKTEWHMFPHRTPEIGRYIWVHGRINSGFHLNTEPFLKSFRGLLDYYWTYGTEDNKPEPPVIEEKNDWIEYAKERPPCDGWYYTSSDIHEGTAFYNGIQFEPFCSFGIKHWRHIPEKDKKYGKQ